MDGLQDETKLVRQGAAQGPQGAPAQVSGDDGAVVADESTRMSRWRKIAGLPESEE